MSSAGAAQEEGFGRYPIQDREAVGPLGQGKEAAEPGRARHREVVQGEPEEEGQGRQLQGVPRFPPRPRRKPGRRSAERAPQDRARLHAPDPRGGPAGAEEAAGRGEQGEGTETGETGEEDRGRQEIRRQPLSDGVRLGGAGRRARFLPVADDPRPLARGVLRRGDPGRTGGAGPPRRPVNTVRCQAPFSRVTVKVSRRDLPALSSARRRAEPTSGPMSCWIRTSLIFRPRPPQRNVRPRRPGRTAGIGGHACVAGRGPNPGERTA